MFGHKIQSYLNASRNKCLNQCPGCSILGLFNKLFYIYILKLFSVTFDNLPFYHVQHMHTHVSVQHYKLITLRNGRPKLESYIMLFITGTRFRPLSLELPKPLFPIAGFPLIHHHIEACSKVYNFYYEYRFTITR